MSKTGIFDYLENLSYEEVKGELLKFFTIWHKLFVKEKEADDEPTKA